MDATEVKKIMFELHEGICATHANGHMIACQALRKGYYWSTIERDYIDDFQKYY